MEIIKRNGIKEEFKQEKIIKAIMSANKDVEESERIPLKTAEGIAEDIYYHFIYKETPTVEQVQDFVENEMQELAYFKLAKEYIKYRYQRELSRVLNNDLKKRYAKFAALISGEDEESKKENSNKDTRIVPTMRDYIAGFTCREMAEKILLPKDVIEAHREGIIHYHDSDYAPAMPMHNCGLINLEDMLQNGTVISGVMIEKPHSFSTACTITTQIITQVASCQYGGNTITLSHLAPFVDVTRQQIIEDVKDEFKAASFDYYNPEGRDYHLRNVVNRRVQKDIAKGIQTIQYQLITMSTTNGQAPFTTLFMYLDEVPEGQTRDDLALVIEEVLRQRIKGVKNDQGYPITVAFPKLIYCLDEDNIHKNSKYYYLTKLAAECSAKRLVPDYISAKVMKKLKGDVYPCMGCRSFLTPDPVNHKYYGRWNQGVVTINLPDVALSSGGDMDKFWEILNERLELCRKALMTRHNTLKGTKSDVAPILWQHGAYARLKPGELIDDMLFDNYSTISLGYAGLYECVKYMTGHSHSEEGIGHDFGVKVMEYLNNTTLKWREETNISFSLYGSPIESTTYKFAKALQNRFGIIEGVTDKDYVTNSYHITPSEHIDAFTKLSKEAEFQRLSPGGAISYVETPNMTKNIDAMLALIEHIYNNNIYAEINTMTSYCKECGCTDIHMEDDLKFHCPQCGNRDFEKMNIALRICGYISTNPFNDGRAADIHDRVYHIGNE